MKLHTVTTIHTSRRKKTRVGRGGKRGTTAGHGTKGQKSRSGHRIRPAERDFIQRLPKLKGVKNKPNTKKIYTVVNVQSLEARFLGKIVSPDTLHKEGFVKNKKSTIKILGNGALSKNLSFSHVLVSKSARKKIESAGGSIKD